MLENAAGVPYSGVGLASFVHHPPAARGSVSRRRQSSREPEDDMGARTDDEGEDESTWQIPAIREVLWPGGDPDHKWSPETLEDIARIVGPPPGDDRPVRAAPG